MYLIKHVVLPNNQASVVLNAIPNTYAHLLLKIKAKTDRSTASFDNVVIKPNGTDGSSRYFFGGPSSSVITGTEGFITAYTGSTNGWGSASIYVYDYASSNSNKGIQGDSVVWQSSILSSATWPQAQAINSLTIEPGDGSIFIADSVFSLYAIPSGAGGPASIS